MTASCRSLCRQFRQSLPVLPVPAIPAEFAGFAGQIRHLSWKYLDLKNLKKNYQVQS
jgi:hypothetical protein